MIVVPRTEHGARGLYQCKDGYVLKVADDKDSGDADDDDGDPTVWGQFAWNHDYNEYVLKERFNLIDYKNQRHWRWILVMVIW